MFVQVRPMLYLSSILSLFLMNLWKDPKKKMINGDNSISNQTKVLEQDQARKFWEGSNKALGVVDRNSFLYIIWCITLYP